MIIMLLLPFLEVWKPFDSQSGNDASNARYAKSEN
jgi:hypothetical protein